MSDDRGPTPSERPFRWSTQTLLLGLLAIIALAWTLRATAAVTLPIAAAFFVAVAVWPVCTWVRKRVPTYLQWLGTVAAMLVVSAMLLLFLLGMGLAAQQLLHRLPAGAGQVRELVTGAFDRLGLPQPASDQIVQAIDRLAHAAGAFADDALQTASAITGGIVIIFFLTLLMLIEVPSWRAKLVSLVGTDEQRWETALAVTSLRFRQYFVTRLLLGAITGALYAGWLAAFGVDLLLVWALLALLLNFVPTIGSVIAGALPVIYVLATRDPGTALAAGAGILVIEQVMGNYVDPRLLGKQLAVSPLVLLAALLIWSWIWGAAGALLSVPMTVLIVILFAQLPSLRPIALLLSNAHSDEELDTATRPGPPKD